MDAFIENSQNNTVDVLKVDVEGHEREVFEGAAQFLKLKKALVIQFERHNDDMGIDHTEHISKMLLRAGYKHSK